MKKIITEEGFSPLPINGYTWTARFEDWDLDDPIGQGRTEDEAIISLLEQIDDEDS